MVKDIAVVVVEPPIHEVVVSTGIQGKRGIPGEQGLKGDIGPQGLIGPAGKELTILIEDSDIFTIDGTHHGNQYICTNELNEYTTVLVGYATHIVNGVEEENKGAVVLFTQASTKQITLQVIDPSISIIAEGALTSFKEGSSIGLIAKDRNTWVLVGSTALLPEVIDDTVYLIAVNRNFGENFITVDLYKGGSYDNPPSHVYGYMDGWAVDGGVLVESNEDITWEVKITYIAYYSPPPELEVVEMFTAPSSGATLMYTGGLPPELVSRLYDDSYGYELEITAVYGGVRTSVTTEIQQI